MRIGRATVISVLLALGAAGSILAGSAAPVAAAQASAAHAPSASSNIRPHMHYHT
jgi:hypothetical protein